MGKIFEYIITFVQEHAVTVLIIMALIIIGSIIKSIKFNF